MTTQQILKDSRVGMEKAVENSKREFSTAFLRGREGRCMVWQSLSKTLSIPKVRLTSLYHPLIPS